MRLRSRVRPKESARGGARSSFPGDMFGESNCGRRGRRRSANCPCAAGLMAYRGWTAHRLRWILRRGERSPSAAGEKGHAEAEPVRRRRCVRPGPARKSAKKCAASDLRLPAAVRRSNYRGWITQFYNFITYGPLNAIKEVLRVIDFLAGLRRRRSRGSTTLGIIMYLLRCCRTG